MSDWLENLKRYALSDDMDYRLTWEDAAIALEEIERLQMLYEGEVENRLNIAKSHDLQTAEIERLQKIQTGLHQECDQLAGECERLRAELERIANWEPHPDGKLEWYDAEEMQKIARAACKKNPQNNVFLDIKHE